MPGWLRSALAFAIGPVKDAVLALTARLTSIWAVATGFFSACRTSFLRLRAKFQGWIAAQWAHAQAVLTTLKWIITTYIPRVATKWAQEIRTWAGGLINDALNWAKNAINEVRRWITGLIADVTNALTSLATWARDQVADLLSSVKRLLTQVFGVLGTPERLALWIAEAMARQLLRFVVDHLEAIAGFLWSRRAALFIKFSDTTEEIISHLL